MLGYGGGEYGESVDGTYYSARCIFYRRDMPLDGAFCAVLYLKIDENWVWLVAEEDLVDIFLGGAMVDIITENF